jgi:4-amino-4-deoxychorismate lyase
MIDFSLIETMRWEPGTGIVRLRLHLARLKRSARRLGFAGAEQAEQRLAEAVAEILSPPVPAGRLPLEAGDLTAATSHRSPSPLRVRLTLSPFGEIAVTTAPFTPLPEDTVWRVTIAANRLDSADKLLRHKTTRREIYEAARAEYPTADADEVLLLNEKSEPCEGTITSIFLDDGTGVLKTPPISCGLLAGVLRTELICSRRARVQRLNLADVKNGRLYIGNSLRGLIKAELKRED